MRHTTSLAKAAPALVLPFVLAHCASLPSERLPLTYDAKSVGGPNSSIPLQLRLPPGNGRVRAPPRPIHVRPRCAVHRLCGISPKAAWLCNPGYTKGGL